MSILSWNGAPARFSTTTAQTAIAALLEAFGPEFRIYIADPTDSACTTIVSNKASAMADRGVNAEHMTQGTAGLRPLDSGAINTRACLRWPAATAGTALNIVNQTWGNARTFAMLYRNITVPSAAQAYPLLALTDSAGAGTDFTRWQLQGSGIGDLEVFRTHASGNGVPRKDTTAQDTSPHLAVYTHSGTDPLAGYDKTTDGAAVTLAAGTSTGSNDTTNPTSTLGSDYSGLNGVSNIDIGLVILGKAIITARQIAALKLYVNKPVASGGWGMSVA